MSERSNGQRLRERFDKQPGQRGFTLLELALVLSIAGIMLAIAVPRMPPVGRTDLESSAERLASTMTYLSDEASLRGRIYRLTLNLDADRWDVAALAPYAATGSAEAKAEFHEDAEDPMARSIVLPRGVFLDAVIDRDGETMSGSRPVYFMPEGLSESFGVRLEESGGATTVVQLDAARGLAYREDTQEPER